MTKEEFIPIAAEIIDVDLDEMLQAGFAEYTLYTIEERAIPDARDGLKPVQRRVVYTGFAEGYFPHKATVKSARIVGTCMGQYHPHGDGSIYDAMVRLAQKHSTFLPLFDGQQGNFGAPGRDAAASRYTETRLSAYGYSSAIELKDKVAPMRPNFDDTLMEPEVLPVKIPLLLINGVQGIAVTVATNMPSHNPREAVKAAIYLLDHQKEWRAIRDSQGEERATLIGRLVDSLMEIIPGPDMPTGGVIMGVDGIREAYITGRGKFVMRGKYKIEQLPRGRKTITFYELPYGKSPSGILDAVVQAEQDYIASTRAVKEWELLGKKGQEPKISGYRLEGVTAVNNLSGRGHPCKLVFEIDAKTNPDAVLAELFKRTGLEEPFSINNTCLVDRSPQVLSLPEILQQFLMFRRSIVKSRLKNEKANSVDRAHILQGLKTVLLDIDKAISIIRGAENQADAKAKLSAEFKIDEAQAKYVTDMRLGRLTKYDTVELSNELADIERRLAELEELIASDSGIDGIIRSELEEILSQMENEESHKDFKKYPTTRRSEIAGVSLKEYDADKKALQSASTEVEDEPITVYLNPAGKVSTEAIKGWALRVPTSTLGHYYAFTDTGFAVKVNTVDTPSGYSVPGLEDGERVVALASGANNVALGTRQGVIHFFNPSFPSNETRFPVAKLAEGDVVVGGGETSGSESDNFVFVSSDSNLLRYEEGIVRARQGINTQGVAGMKVGDGSEVILFEVVPADGVEHSSVVTYTGDDGSVKSTPLTEFPTKGRGTGGVRSHTFRKGEERLAQAVVDKNPIVLVKGTRKAVLASQFEGKRSASGSKMPAPIHILKNS